jgi:hypothetical protein
VASIVWNVKHLLGALHIDLIVQPAADYVFVMVLDIHVQLLRAAAQLNAQNAHIFFRIKAVLTRTGKREKKEAVLCVNKDIFAPNAQSL